MKIYLDDIRTPVEKEWIVVRSYDEFVKKVLEIGLENLTHISLDHDLGDTAMMEYHNNVSPNYTLNYENILEKTGYDAVKWIVNHFYDKNPNYSSNSNSYKKKNKIVFPLVTVHSANPIGCGNMMGYINNFLMNERQPQTCVKNIIEHTA